MRYSIFCTILLAISLGCWTGCTQQTPKPADEHAGHDHGAEAHGSHTPKHNQVLVEFPGHKYTMEITDDHDTGLVSAYLTDAEFENIDVDSKEVKLNFLVDGAPKSFVLTRAASESGKPVTFTSSDKDLEVLICDGWKGEATAVVEIAGSPNSAALKKLSGDDHSHEGHSHEGHSH